ncbi:MAG: DUF4384 domain-containing protein [Blastocatellia bacterium]
MMYRQFLIHSKLRASFWQVSGWLAAVMVALLAVPLVAQQGQKEGAKTIFYNPSTGAASKPGLKPEPKKGTSPKNKSPQSQDDKILVTRTQKTEEDKIQVTRTQTAPAMSPGIHYWFEMDGVGKVSEDRVFYTGERLRLHLRSNVDGYLSLWAYDSSGASKLLFPSPDSSADNKALTFSPDSNFVHANNECTPGAIVFSPPAEDERLLIFFSTSKDDVPSPLKNSLTAEQIKEATQVEGGKSLLFEVEKKDLATFGSYVANRQGGGITREVILKHRPRKGDQ